MSRTREGEEKRGRGGGKGGEEGKTYHTGLVASQDMLLLEGCTASRRSVTPTSVPSATAGNTRSGPAYRLRHTRTLDRRGGVVSATYTPQQQ